MSFKRILSWIALPITTGLAIAGCGPQQSPNHFQRPDFSDRKSEEARAACAESRLLQDMGLSGDFLYKLVLCSSNQSQDGGESLGDLVKLVKKLGPQNLDFLVEFLLRPNPRAGSTEATYPYLTAFSYLLERGSSSADGIPVFALQDERFGPLQELLLQIRPNQAIDLLLEWNRTGQLGELLAELALFIESLDEGSISAISSEFLIGQSLGPGLRSNVIELLRYDPLMFELEAFIRPERSQRLRVGSQGENNPCFEEWLNRRPGSAQDQACDLAGQLDEQSPAKLGAERLQAGFDQLNPAERTALIDSGLAFLDHFSELDDQDRHGFAVRLLESLEYFWQHNRENSRYLTSLLQMLLDTKARDFSQVAEAAATLLAPNYSQTLDKLRVKLSESIIQEQIEDWLVRGGDVPGCNGLQLPGLAEGSSSSVVEQMQVFLSPHPACFDMPPLLAASTAQFGIFLHDSCLEVNSEFPCMPLLEENHAVLDVELSQDDSPALQRDFLMGALEATISELNLDPFYLQSQHLAPGQVSPEHLQELLQIVQARSSMTIDDLVDLDKWLNLHPRFHKLFHDDFIESLLAHRATILAAQGEQFSGLIPDLPLENHKSEYRATRVFAGAYLGGPLEWLLKNELNQLASNKLQAYPDLADYFQADPSQLALFLRNMKDADAIFKNPIYAKRNEDVISVRVPGSHVLDFLGFDQDGHFTLYVDEMIRPELVLSPTENLEDEVKGENWALWNRFLDQQGLIAKDLPAKLSQDFNSWTRDLFRALEDGGLWLNSITRQEASRPTDPAFSQFFIGDDYAEWEARALVLYILQHYYKSERLLPLDASFHGDAMPTADLPVRGFMNASYLSTPFLPSKPWSVFVSLFPEILKSQTISFDQLAEKLLPTFEELMAMGSDYFRVQGYGLRRNLDGFSSDTFSETVKLFSALNLLSFTETRSAAFLQPVIGFNEQVCAPDQRSAKFACPIEIAPTQTAHDSYDAYRKFVSTQFTEVLCPLSREPKLTQKADWTEQLGFSFAELAAQCSLSHDDYRRFQWDDHNRFPTWAVAQVLEDVFKLGKNPRLRPELQSLASRMRWQKLTQAEDRYAELSPAQLAQAWLQTAHWPVHPKATAKGRYRQQAAGGFRMTPPAIISFYLSLVDDAMSSELYDGLLIQSLMTQLETPTDPVTEFLESFIKVQREHAAQDTSALAMLLDFQSQLSDSAELTVIHSLLHLNSLQNYDFLARDLPLAVKSLLPDLDWQDPGLHLTKQMILRSHMAGASRLGNRLKSSELKTGLRLMTEQLERFGPISSQERVLRIFLELTVEQLASVKLDEYGEVILPSADQLDQLLHTLARMRLQASFHRQLNQWIGLLSQPLRQLNGEKGPSLRTIIQQGLEFFMSRSARLVQIHWDAQTSSRHDPYFWSNLGLDLLEPFAANPSAAEALQAMLADPRLGLVGPDQLVLATVQDERSRLDLVEAIRVLSMASSQDWLAAGQQSGELLGANERFLQFVDERMQWDDDQAAKELELALGSIRRVGENDADLWDRQLEVVDSWFQAIPDEARLRNYYPRKQN